MLKILLLVLVAGLALLLLQSRLRGPRRKDRAQDKPGSQSPPQSPPPAPPQAMVACAHCGLHLPQADAVADADGRLFCSAAHRLAGPA